MKLVIYLSASGGTARENVAQPENSVGSSRTSESKMLTRASQEEKSCKSEPQSDGKKSSADYHDDHLWLGASGSHNFYPESDHIYRGWISSSRNKMVEVLLQRNVS